MALTRTQEKAARLLGLGVCKTKVEVCKKVGISKRTLYNWLQNEDFLKKIEEFRHSAEVQLTPEYIIENTSADDKVQLVKLLQKDVEISSHLFPEIKTLVGRVRKANPKYDDFLLRDIDEELNKVQGIIQWKLGSKAFNENGELISKETDWYEYLDKLGERTQLLELLDSADHEENDGLVDDYVHWEETEKHHAYKKAINNIEEEKGKLKATGKVIEADP